MGETMRRKMAAVSWVEIEIGDMQDWLEFVEENDYGSGCDDIAHAIEKEFGIPQVYGYLDTPRGLMPHSWNQTNDGTIVDAARHVFPEGEEGLFIIEPGEPEHQDYDSQSVGVWAKKARRRLTLDQKNIRGY